jgi:plastocyanin
VKRLLLLTLLLPLSAFAVGLLLLTLLLPQVAHAADDEQKPTDYKLVINDHFFQPAEIVIPSGTKIKLTVENRDATPEEFDSYPLNREKAIAGHSKATIYIGPLEPGRYTFSGEFHADTAQGVIIVQEEK